MANLKTTDKNSQRHNDYYYNNTKKALTIASMVLLVFVMISTVTAPSIALAASPHFIGTPTITKNPNGSLITTFKAAGLGNTVTEVALTSTIPLINGSSGDAVLQCVNPGGNNPPPNHVTFRTQGQIVFIQPTNGQITGTISLGPPALPSASQICPNPNWSVLLLSITYFNTVLHIMQNGQEVLVFNFGNVDPKLNVYL
jgi:hypothetical protein